MKLINPQKITIVQEFIDEFGASLIAESPSSNIDFVFINEEHDRSQWIATPNTPFATNPLFPGVIVMNERICAELMLDNREQFSMLFHEIGHVLDSTERVGNGFNRELNADQLAAKFGLSEALASGLTKIVESGKYKDTETDMCERIAVLRK